MTSIERFVLWGLFAGFAAIGAACWYVILFGH